LEAIDSRLIGFGYIKIHGLCQIKVKYKGFNKTYCIDIKDHEFSEWFFIVHEQSSRRGRA